MPEETLKASVDKIRQHLAEPDKLDAQTRQQLSAIADEIDKAIEDPENHAENALASIENSALEFEARHPAFARILSEVTDALAKLGF